MLGAEGFGALEAIAGGRLAAVGAVLVEALFQPGDAGFKLGEEFTDGVQPTCIKGGLDGRADDFGTVNQSEETSEVRRFV